MASIGALLDHLVRERAASDYDDDGIPGLDVRDIHILSLHVDFPPDEFMTSLN
jgi:DNA mismatch repair protein MSH5